MLEGLDKNLGENAIALVCLTVVACWALRVGSGDVALAIVSGVIGYMTKSAQKAAP
jgi:hypothetical protein